MALFLLSEDEEDEGFCPIMCPGNVCRLNSRANEIWLTPSGSATATAPLPRDKNCIMIYDAVDRPFLRSPTCRKNRGSRFEIPFEPETTIQQLREIIIQQSAKEPGHSELRLSYGSLDLSSTLGESGVEAGGIIQFRFVKL